MTDGVKAQLLESNSDILPTPAGCISKCQSVDVSLDKQFKAVLIRSWVKYASSVVEGFTDANNDTSFKLPVPTRQHMIDWVKEGFDYLVQDQEMVKFAALAHRIQIKCGIVPFSNSVWERHCTIWRSMMLMKLMMIILLNCSINILL